ncbi:MAG: hypothetical protein PHS32_22945 [Rhodoferax sp.]|uniref:hypothetical protein n=1 Tax=Rhodoferax sp. TaxID=50421 RepID=UPI00260E115C|nr:hypothetical protein [Rhodoferax sp.]MDD5336605.1 hypothetical protein [Rhodoferax sp.]
MEALVGATLSVVIGMAIGLFIKYRIWGAPHQARTVVDHGMAWAAYVSFFSVLSSAYFFYHDSLNSAVAKALLNVFVFPLFSFLAGLVWGYFKTREIPLEAASQAAGPPDTPASTALVVAAPAAPAEPTEELMWASALTEFESKQRRAGLWAKSFAQAAGNEAQAKACYLKQRVAELQAQQQQQAALLQGQQVAQARALLESRGYSITAARQDSDSDARRQQDLAPLPAAEPERQVAQHPKRRQPALDAPTQELAQQLKSKVKEYSNWRDAHRLALLLGYVVVILHTGVFRQATFQIFDNATNKKKIAELASPEEFVAWTLETLC